MKIAVDVLGTIEGSKKASVITMIHAFQDAGHTVVVWSSEYGLAVNAVKKYDLECEPRSKIEKGNVDPVDYFDIAIEDDRRQDYLAAHRFVWVDEIPKDFTAAKKLAEDLCKGAK